MSQPIPIVADPVSSDGSEESWILLDEMDEAMREEFNGASNLNEIKNDDVTTATSSEEVALVDESSSPEIEMVNENYENDDDDVDGPIVANDEPSVDYPSNIETMSSAEAISACPSNEEDDDDDVNDVEHLRSVLEKSSALKVYDDLNDGSTTDGSISIIGEGERNHCQEEINEGHGIESDELSTPASAATTTAAAASASVPQPLQMWMRCTPIDMSICSKRPLPPRPYEPHRCQRPTSVAELGLAEQNIASDLLNYLERLNNFLSSIYLLQVVLLFLTAGSVALLAIIYSRYSACKLEIKDLEQKLYSTKADKYQIEGNLARCEYLYEMELEKTTATATATVNSDFKPATDGDIKVTIDAAVPTQTDGQNFNVKPEILPTRRLASVDEHLLVAADGENLQTVWTGADDNLIATKKPRFNTKEKHFAAVECADIDDGSLFSEYNREYCENQKKNQPAKVYATHYSYKAIDDGECNPNKIDFTLGFEHARKILRETNCDDDGTLTYLEKAYENFEANTKNEQSSMKRHKQHTKKTDKSNVKWEKAQKINSSVIKIDKFNDDSGYEGDSASSAEDRFERKEKRNQRRGDKKSKRNDADYDDDGDKENNRRRRSDRKDATATAMNKKFNPDKDVGGKRIRNDRKRDMVKIYEHRHDD